MPVDCVEIETAPNPRHSILWLHGLGADGHDFEPIVPELASRAWPPLRFVFPHAPVRPITINGGVRMRAWYDIASFDFSGRIEDVHGICASIAELERLIAQEVDRGIAAGRIFLAGFSQGGAIALACGVRHATRLAGLIGLSTYLPLADATAVERSAASADVPIFMGHGSFDPVVAQALGVMSRDALRGLGYGVDWRAYPMAHQVCAEEIADLRDWLGARLRAPEA